VAKALCDTKVFDIFVKLGVVWIAENYLSKNLTLNINDKTKILGYI